MLGNRSRDRFKNLPLGKLRQRRILCAVLLRLCFERSAETSVNVFPACRQNRFALGGELLAAAIKNRRNGFILLRRGNGTQQLAADKDISFFSLSGSPSKPLPAKAVVGIIA